MAEQTCRVFFWSERVCSSSPSTIKLCSCLAVTGIRRARVPIRRRLDASTNFAAVAGVGESVLASYNHPSRTSGAGFYDVPRIESVEECLDSKRTAPVFRLTAVSRSRCGEWVCIARKVVLLPWKSEQVHHGEYSHLDTEKH